MNFRLLTLCFIFGQLVFQARAFENEFFMRAGFAYSVSRFNSFTDDELEQTKKEQVEETKSYGVHTSFAYRFKRLELGVESRITLGKATDVTFDVEDSEVFGSGNIRLVDITPYIRFDSRPIYFPKVFSEYFLDLKSHPWIAYVKLGPSWTIQSIELDEFNIEEQFREDHKLTYESFGGSFSLGIEEKLPFKDMNPVYFEVNASYYESYKVSLVDATDSQLINILSSKEAKQVISSFHIIFIFGMTLF